VDPCEAIFRLRKEYERITIQKWGSMLLLTDIMPSMSKTNGLCPKFTRTCSPVFFIPTEGKSFPFISRNAVPDKKVNMDWSLDSAREALSVTSTTHLDDLHFL
jgi:hypothetical protein